MSSFIDDRLAIELPEAESLEDRQLLQAMSTLSEFVVTEAEKARAQLGFGWQPKIGAPKRYPDLLEAFRHAQLTGSALPVSNEHAESVIYVSPHVNSAMRFWHDVSHVRTGLTFELIDELELAHVHLDALADAGFAKESLEWQLLHCDLAGQAYLLAMSGDFPVDQRAFAKRCIQQGLDRGLIATARQERRAS